MRKIFWLLMASFLFSCGRHSAETDNRIITVSIAPFKYFVEQIAGNDFKVNIMVPPGADAHTYEPVPGQINNLRKSVAYISNGYLSFEMTWLDRFYDVINTVGFEGFERKFIKSSAENHNRGMACLL